MLQHKEMYRCRDSSVSIVTRLLDDRESIPERCERFFSSLPRQDQLLDPPNLLSNGYLGGNFLRVNVPEREAYHRPPRLRVRAAIPPLPQFIFMVWYTSCYVTILIERARKITTIFGHIKRYWGRYSNQIPPTYEAGVSTTITRRPDNVSVPLFPSCGQARIKGAHYGIEFPSLQFNFR
jgi:hypothetical protein